VIARAIVVSLAAVLVLSAATAQAGPTATITVQAGDGLAIKGSDIQCGVSSALPQSIACVVGTQAAAKAGSYGFTIADQGAAIFSASGTKQIVARETNPAIVGTPVKSSYSTKKAKGYVLAAGENMLIAGTHLWCERQQASKNAPQALECGVLTTSSKGHYVPGTYIAVLSDKAVAIMRAGKNGSQTQVAVRKQP
jgi:hypothetical protein